MKENAHFAGINKKIVNIFYTPVDKLFYKYYTYEQHQPYAWKIYLKKAQKTWPDAGFFGVKTWHFPPNLHADRTRRKGFDSF
jgi:hypothetical protein